MVRWVRTGRAKAGKMSQAVQWAKEIAEYINRGIPLTPVITTCSISEWRTTLGRFWSLNAGSPRKRRAANTFSHSDGLMVLCALGVPKARGGSRSEG